MGMRIWHQSFTVLSDLAAYDEALRDHFRRVARPDTVVDMHGMRAGTYRTDYPGDDIKHVGFQFLHSIQFLQGALQAERQGYDAYALSTLPEPGLREIRALVDIPVVGYGECAARAAVDDGRKFGALVFIPELAELYRDNVRRHGIGCRLVGACDVGFRFTDVLAGFSSPGPLIDRFREAARGLIAKGAEAIVPGEAPLTVLLAMNGVVEVDGVPVIDSLGAWVRAAESAVDARRSGEGNHGSGYFGAIPDPARRDEILDFYGLNPA
ncbi:aspartate/glutamate racemase family protein [Sphingobium estronivorans]|uniref:aspartate/glutamate racemase family protein n=1 Tax=Sphingobium estronivorans TaxID=1577690 RepID=UPI001239870E|nr:aspartate/glutamate racemase family protein [Sphingobium estronivorans]